jgi:cyanate permease
MSAAIISYAFTLFLPIILQDGAGFSQELAFILSAPPALFAVVEALIVSYYADRLRLRGPFVVSQAALGIVGLAMVAFLKSPWSR